MPVGTFTAVMRKQGSSYVAECPAVGTVSRGRSIEEAIANLKVATELHLEGLPSENSGPPLLTVFAARYA